MFLAAGIYLSDVKAWVGMVDRRDREIYEESLLWASIYSPVKAQFFRIRVNGFSPPLKFRIDCPMIMALSIA